MKSIFTGNDIKLPGTELLKSIPEFFGIRLNEEPQYDSVHEEDDIEIRKYPALMTASITLQAEFDVFRKEAFNRLASYIFGENSSQEKLAMTAPVLQDSSDKEKMAMTAPVLQQGEGNTWTMTFVLPEKYLTHAPPTPIDPQIVVKKTEPKLVVATEYSGNNDKEKMQEAKVKLENWLAKQSDYKPITEIYWAQYDAPFVIPFLKRNEALVEVRMPN